MLRIKMRGDSQISYEPLKVIGSLLDDGTVLNIYTSEFRKTYTDDKVFFIRKD